MKRRTKIALIAAAVLIALGLAAVMAAYVLYDGESPYDAKTNEVDAYEISEAFTSVSIRADSADIRIAASEDGNCRAEYEENETLACEISVTDGELHIVCDDTRAWYDMAGFFFDSPEIVLYLPSGTYETLSLAGTSGSIEAAGGLSFKNADISCTSGSIKLENLSVAEALSVETASGSAAGSNISCGSLAADVTSGSIRLEDVIAAGHLEAETQSGSITLTRCDAQTLRLQAVSGLIRGSLLSEKVFDAHSVCGSIQIPQSADGGICELETTSGSIRITVE